MLVVGEIGDVSEQVGDSDVDTDYATQHLSRVGIGGVNRSGSGHNQTYKGNAAAE